MARNTPVNRATADSSIGSRAVECENSELKRRRMPEIRGPRNGAATGFSPWLGDAKRVFQRTNREFASSIQGGGAGSPWSRAIEPPHAGPGIIDTGGRRG